MNPPTINFQYFFDQRMVEAYVTLHAKPALYGFNAAEIAVKTIFNDKRITMRAIVICEINKHGHYEMIHFASLN